jgi:hypothetical protein
MKAADISVKFLFLPTDTRGLQERYQRFVKEFKRYLQGNKSRIECLRLMLLGLFAVKVVNLQEIALAFQSEAKVYQSQTGFPGKEISLN